MESTDARRAFPCWDEPELKATFEVTLVVDDSLAAYSNGSVAEETPVPGGKRRVRFAPTMVMSTYLVAFIVGPLEATEPLDVAGVPLRIVHTPGKSDLTPFALAVGAHALTFFTEYFGIPYPADKLDLVAIPDFAFGAMENLGCVTFRESVLLVDPAQAARVELERVADVVCHEIAHMWFGDLVTMKWWNGIWLNEAFATFMEVLAVDAFRPEWQRWVSFGVEREAAMAVDGLHATRPVEFHVGRPEEAQGMFDVLTYQKGGSVLRMLEQFIGPDVFREGINDYLTTHSYGNTETSDLWDALERSSGRGGAQHHGLLDRAGWLPAGPGGRGRLARAGPLLLPGRARRRHRLELEGPGADRARCRPPISTPCPFCWRVRRRSRWPGAPAIWSTPVARATTGSPTPRRWSGSWPAGWATWPPWSGTTWCRTPGLRPSPGRGRWPTSWPSPGPWRTQARVIRACGRSSSARSGSSSGSYPTAIGRCWPWRCAPCSGLWPRDLGWDPRDEDGERTASLRSSVLRTLGTIGDDPDVKAEATRRFAQAGTMTLHPDLESAVLDIVASDGGAAEFEAFLARYRAPSTPQEEIRYLYALASFSDPVLASRTFDLALTEVRTQNAPFLLQALLANRSVGPMIWGRITEEWDTLVAKFPSNILPRMLDGVRALCNPPELADQVTAFVETHPLAAGGKTVEQILERLSVNVAFGRARRCRSGGNPRRLAGSRHLLNHPGCHERMATDGSLT